jgi:hypothetical protein
VQGIVSVALRAYSVERREVLMSDWRTINRRGIQYIEEAPDPKKKKKKLDRLFFEEVESVGYWEEDEFEAFPVVQK